MLPDAPSFRCRVLSRLRSAEILIVLLLSLLGVRVIVRNNVELRRARDKAGVELDSKFRVRKQDGYVGRNVEF